MSVERRSSGIAVKIAAYIAAIGSIAVLIVYATKIQMTLDQVAHTSTTNCNLIKTAIILSIAESTKTPTPLSSRILANFQVINCG